MPTGPGKPQYRARAKLPWRWLREVLAACDDFMTLGILGASLSRPSAVQMLAFEGVGSGAFPFTRLGLFYNLDGLVQAGSVFFR